MNRCNFLQQAFVGWRHEPTLTQEGWLLHQLQYLTGRRPLLWQLMPTWPASNEIQVINNYFMFFCCRNIRFKERPTVIFKIYKLMRLQNERHHYLIRPSSRGICVSRSQDSSDGRTPRRIAFFMSIMLRYSLKGRLPDKSSNTKIAKEKISTLTKKRQ